MFREIQSLEKAHKDIESVSDNEAENNRGKSPKNSRGKIYKLFSVAENKNEKSNAYKAQLNDRKSVFFQ